MAYYDALIAAWNSATQPPSGVTGSALLAGDTTAQKCAKVNGWRYATAKPAIIPTYQIYNVISRAEFDALTAALQQSVRDILSMGTVDGSPGTQIRARMISIFPSGTTTFTNLNALVQPFDNATTNWCSFYGYPYNGVADVGNLTVRDAAAAGVS